jgi:amino acid transporter
MSGAGRDGRGPGLREVLAIAAVVVLLVLAIEAVSTAVPAVHDLFRTVPITVIVLVAGTGLVLALILRRPRGVS